MSEVGVRELKEHLSEYLERAQRGEVVTVTDRGRPKAVLGPLPGRARIDAGIAEGWITPASAGPLEPTAHWKGARTVLDALAEDRGE
ncbi:MAG TPA: type II toxin-antitoxin system prevent-host-death family antitoxin [Solirubrobacteraceae bacterium]|jgi:prevent-host-death family protein|nr:type II toxin-antitoxin system prevent-host-death family antitoxin [Solirubrobacteraceae bacterium]